MQTSKSISKTRYEHWCHNRAKDGRICALYLNHKGKHKSNHMQSEWEDGE